jgi:hypothetical protein
MDLAFSSPWAGLVAIAALVPLCVLAISELRTRRLRTALGLPQPLWRSVAWPVVAVCAVPLLLGLAAAEPVLKRTETHFVRTDAAAFFVLDTSRSMLASRSASGPTRFDRARSAAFRLRAGISDVPAGIASLTDRLLPHLFPSASVAAFSATLERAVGVEHPPPERVHQRATSLFPLAALAVQNYFADSAKHRVAIVLTDGESSPFDDSEVVRDLRGAKIQPVFVRLWSNDERVFGKGRKPESYRPDAGRSAELDRLAKGLGTRVFSENDLGAATSAVRQALGRGPRISQGRDEHSLELAPYAALGALLPLAFLLWRRNLWGLVDRERLRELVGPTR